MPPRVNRMGKFQDLVDSPAGMEGFRAKYRISQGVGLEYCSSDQILTKRETGQIVIPDRFHRRRNDDSHGEDN